MTEPPPDVVAPEHRWIWYAACRLLEQNASVAFTILAIDGDPSDNPLKEWHNSGMEQERDSRKAHGAGLLLPGPAPKNSLCS